MKKPLLPPKTTITPCIRLVSVLAKLPRITMSLMLLSAATPSLAAQEARNPSTEEDASNKNLTITRTPKASPNISPDQKNELTIPQIQKELEKYWAERTAKYPQMQKEFTSARGAHKYELATQIRKTFYQIPPHIDECAFQLGKLATNKSVELLFQVLPLDPERSHTPTYHDSAIGFLGATLGGWISANPVEALSAIDANMSVGFSHLYWNQAPVCVMVRDNYIGPFARHILNAIQQSDVDPAAAANCFYRDVKEPPLFNANRPDLMKRWENESLQRKLLIEGDTSLIMFELTRRMNHTPNDDITEKVYPIFLDIRQPKPSEYIPLLESYSLMYRAENVDLEDFWTLTATMAHWSAISPLDEVAHSINDYLQSKKVPLVERREFFKEELQKLDPDKTLTKLEDWMKNNPNFPSN